MQLAAEYALLGYGATMRFEKRRDADRNPFPSGEAEPPFERWLDLLCRCETFEVFRGVWSEAVDELSAWKRRPDAPPQGETLAQMQSRIIDEGEGWEVRDVALVFRCTPTLVRRTRIERERNPDTGRIEGSLQHAKDLLARGLSLRQVAVLTGIPKSTLHDAALKG